MPTYQHYQPPARPPKYYENPLVFLAGPIQGTRDWQAEAASALLGYADVANPRRACWEKLDEAGYQEQVSWETTMFRVACLKGCLLFWLERESEPILGRAHAQTTRFELGEWLTRAEYWDVPLVLGIHPEFSGRRYILARLAQRLAQREMPGAQPYAVRDTLADTVKDALAIVRRP